MLRHRHAVASLVTCGAALALAPSATAGWKSDGPVEAGTASSAAHLGATVHLAARGGQVLRSADGARWRAVAIGPAVEAAVAAGAGSAYVLRGGTWTNGWRILRSVGGTASFRTAGAPPAADDYTAFAADPARRGALYLATPEEGGIGSSYRSADGGRTWHELDGLGSGAAGWVERFAFVAAEPGAVYALGGDLSESATDRSGPLARSLDGGRTWRLVGRGLPAGFVAEALAADPSRPAVRLLSGTPRRLGDPSLYRSVDGGRTWQVLRSAPAGGVDRIAWAGGRAVIALGPDVDAPVARLRGGGGVYVSADRGIRWSRVRALPVDALTATIDADARGAFQIATADDGAWLWRRGWAAPRRVAIGSQASHVSALAATRCGGAGRLLAGLAGNGVATLRAGGWVAARGLPAHARVLALRANGCSVLAALGRDGLYVSSDAGLQFRRLRAGYVPVATWDGAAIWLADGDGVWHADGLGRPFSAVPGDVPVDLHAVAIAVRRGRVAVDAREGLYVGDATALTRRGDGLAEPGGLAWGAGADVLYSRSMTSADAGVTWSSPRSADTVYDLALDPGRPSWRAISRPFGVAITDDDGATWTQLAGTFFSEAVTIVGSGPGRRLFAGARDGLREWVGPYVEASDADRLARR